ncbi:transcriptional adaptor 2 [Ascodesmis nigricans]|uniref:Transcriptional adapter 2 n=1 Tax=Ascodesmis nigricans TaxID=341454 RepID=A0A4S2N7U4_9PEZI|nr:transcriptional adaptor 2 [Ascodesmis nigricans]
MGQFKRKNANPGRVEPGVRYHCDACNTDITFTVRIRCAHSACSEYDLCVPCFSSGAETGLHKCATHPYQVIEQNSYPIFTDDWGADEEMLLLQGAEMYGLGSWADIANHIGGARDKEEVRKHYLETYVNSSKFPLPEHCDPADMTFSNVSREDFASRKKRRIESRKEAQAKAQPTESKSRPTASVPACHEIQGYMPGRMEFETEWENEAEMAVKDLFFEPGSGINPHTGLVEPEVELKCTVMDIYNHKLTQRALRKKVMFEHGLLNYRENTTKEKKRTKEERDLLNKAKPFAKMMRKPDYDTFSDGLLKELMIRQAITQLQEWRKMGIQTIEAGQRYEVEKVQRNEVLRNKLMPLDRLTHRYSASKATPPVETPPVNPLLSTKSFPSSTPLIDGIGSPASPTPVVNGTKRNASGAPVSLGVLENAADAHLLSKAEQQLCISLSIKPKPYMCIKERLITEAIKNGGVLKEKTAKEVCRIDNQKLSKIHEFFTKSGWVGKA